MRKIFLMAALITVSATPVFAQSTGFSGGYAGKGPPQKVLVAPPGQRLSPMPTVGAPPVFTNDGITVNPPHKFIGSGDLSNRKATANPPHKFIGK